MEASRGSAPYLGHILLHSAPHRVHLPHLLHPNLADLKRQRTTDGEVEEEDVPEHARVHPLKVNLSLPLMTSATSEAVSGGEGEEGEAGEAGEASEASEAATTRGRVKLQFCCVTSQSLLGIELIAADGGSGQRAGHDVAMFAHLFGEDSGSERPTAHQLQPEPEVLLLADEPAPAAAVGDLAAKRWHETLTSLLPAVPFLWVQVASTCPTRPPPSSRSTTAPVFTRCLISPRHG